MTRPEALEECAVALEQILSDVSLDWYVQQFAKSEAPSGISSGVVGKIHNAELRQRAAMAFEQGRQAIAALKAST